MKIKTEQSPKCIMDELPDQRVGMSKEDHAICPKHHPKEQHTPTPWFKEADAFYSSNGSEIIDSNGYRIADHLKPEDAALIVKAVNSHEALVESAKYVVDYFYPTPYQWEAIKEKFKKAIAQAEGGK